MVHMEMKLCAHMYFIVSRVAYRIFYGGGGGGHTLVRPLGGLVACSPRKCLYSTLDFDLILGGGGGGGTQAGGGKSQCAPPLYATLVSMTTFNKKCPQALFPITTSFSNL